MKFKQKKTRKKRGSTYHGWGRGASHHKGAGNRGGRGRAGSGKKADQMKPSFWEEKVGKHGFSSKSRFKISTINISKLQSSLADLTAKGSASKKESGFAVDLKKEGYDKLLGTGKPTIPLFISVDFASAGAVEKIKAAGGSVEVLKVKAKKKKKTPANELKKAGHKKQGKKAKEEPEE